MLQFKSFEAPKRFIFQDPDTGRIYEADNKKDLLTRIINYREQNKLEPIEALELVVENYWCGLKENAGKCRVLKLNRGWRQVMNGGIALLTNVFLPEKSRVTQEEADKRSKICTDCNYNVFPDKNFYAKWADELMEDSIGDARSINHDKLGNCAACTCPLRPKVWSKGPFSFTTEEYEKLPEWCWCIPNAKISKGKAA